MGTASKRHKGRAVGGAQKKSFRGMTAKRYEATMKWDHLSFYTKNDFNHWKKNVTNMSIMWEQKKHIIHMAHMMILLIIIS